MPDANGTPSTNYSIPTYNTAGDPPSGKGLNTIVAFLDSLFVNSGTLFGAVARTIVRKNGSTIGTRRAINFIEGSSITLTTADNSGNEAVDVTIAYSGVTSSVPAGAVVDYAGSSAPTGWLLCDGSAVSRSTYSALFTAISTNYGVGDGSTTFNLPDYRGRVGVGKGTHVDVDALNDNDGVAVGSRTPNHTHTTPNHSHNVTITDNSNAGSGGGNPTGAPGTYGTTNASPTTNAGTAPYVVVNKIIKT